MESTSTPTQNPIAAITEPPVTDPVPSTEKGDHVLLSEQIAALEGLTVSGLQRKYREVYGYATTNRSKASLKKRIICRLQDKAEGGFSGRAMRKIRELREMAPSSFHKAKDKPIVDYQLDPRLPPIGGVLVKEYHAKRYEVKVLENGFEWDGQFYKSLSAVAKGISRTKWNPNTFFNLEPLKGRKIAEGVGTDGSPADEAG